MKVCMYTDYVCIYIHMYTVYPYTYLPSMCDVNFIIVFVFEEKRAVVDLCNTGPHCCSLRDISHSCKHNKSARRLPFDYMHRQFPVHKLGVSLFVGIGRRSCPNTFPVCWIINNVRHCASQSCNTPLCKGIRDVMLLYNCQKFQIPMKTHLWSCRFW